MAQAMASWSRSGYKKAREFLKGYGATKQERSHATSLPPLPVERDDAEVEDGGRGGEHVERLPDVAPVLAKDPHLQQKR